MIARHPITIAFIATLTLGMLFGCSRGAANNGEVVQKSETIKVTLPSSITKVSVSDNGSFYPLSWQLGDEITIIGSSVNTFSILPGFTATVAEFSGLTVGGFKYKIIHPGTITSITGFNEYDYTKAVQSTNGSMDHIKYVTAITDSKTYKDVTFSREWAEANGATFTQSSVLKVEAVLPENATAATRLTLSSDNPCFYTTNASTSPVREVSLSLNGVIVGDDSKLTAYIELPGKEISLPAGSGIKVSVETLDASYVQTYTLASGLTISGGKVSGFAVNDASAWLNEGGRYLSGDGTETNPYLIGSAKQLKNIYEDLVADGCVWFSLAKDIDMSGVTDWKPLNTESGFKKKIFFDGNNHTITNFSCSEGTYPSFCGVLNGTVQNVTFDGVSLSDTKTGTYVGTIAGCVGYNNINGTVKNVTVKNVSIKTMALSSAGANGAGFGAIAGESLGVAGEQNCFFENVSVKGFTFEESDNNNDWPRNVGGFIGLVRTAGGSFRDCSVEDVNIKGWICLGGFAGYERAGLHMYENCTVKNVTLTSNVGGSDRVSYVAGFIGCFNSNGSSLDNCHVDGFTFHGNTYCQVVGGLLGQSYGGIDAGLGHGPKITRCSVQNTSLSSIGDKCGGLVGFVSSNTIIEDSWADVNIAGGNETMIGGLVGAFDGATADQREVRRCFAMGSVSGGAMVGGLIGSIKQSNYDTDKSHLVENCIAWNPSVTSLRNNDSTESSGAIIGMAGKYNTLTNNLRNPAMTFTDSTEAVYDQENTDETHALNAGHYTKHYAYHGKAASTGASLSQAASSMGWSADIWNFSGSVPQLK